MLRRLSDGQIADLADYIQQGLTPRKRVKNDAALYLNQGQRRLIACLDDCRVMGASASAAENPEAQAEPYIAGQHYA